MTEQHDASARALDMIRGAAQNLDTPDVLAAIHMLAARVDDAHADELQSVADGLGRARYFAYVRSIAEELDTEARSKLRAGEDADDVHETIGGRLHEACDGSGWIIYTGDAIRALLYSDNDDAHEDELGEPGASWNVLAFYALQADIQDRMTDVYELAEQLEDERDEAVAAIMSELSEEGDDDDAVDDLRSDPTDYDAAGRLLSIVPSAADAIRTLLGLDTDADFPPEVLTARDDAAREAADEADDAQGDA